MQFTALLFYLSIYNSSEKIGDKRVGNTLQKRLCFRRYKMNHRAYLYGYFISSKYCRSTRQIYITKFLSEEHFNEIGGARQVSVTRNVDYIFWTTFSRKMQGLAENTRHPDFKQYNAVGESYDCL